MEFAARKRRLTAPGVPAGGMHITSSVSAPVLNRRVSDYTESTCREWPAPSSRSGVDRGQNYFLPLRQTDPHRTCAALACPLFWQTWFSALAYYLASHGSYHTTRQGHLINSATHSRRKACSSHQPTRFPRDAHGWCCRGTTIFN